MGNILVIACGNTLRCDDGIAWHAAQALRHELPYSAEVISVQQLTPELAENVSHAEIVIFMDASKDGGQPGAVRCEAVFAQQDRVHSSHQAAPTEILALCDRLYLARPLAFVISVRGECFKHGQELSRAAANAIPEVVARACTLIKQWNQGSEVLKPLIAPSETYAL
jgi:hydrogenase maturation protease